MPGLFGIVNADRKKLPLRIENMRNALHVGHERVRDRWIDEKTGVGLGRESLGIFNPDPQPVFNREGTSALIMEGKLYDTKPLREMLATKGYQTDHERETYSICLAIDSPPSGEILAFPASLPLSLSS